MLTFLFNKQCKNVQTVISPSEPEREESEYNFYKHNLHYFDLWWICCTTSCTTNRSNAVWAIHNSKNSAQAEENRAQASGYS